MGDSAIWSSAGCGQGYQTFLVSLGRGKTRKVRILLVSLGRGKTRKVRILLVSLGRGKTRKVRILLVSSRPFLAESGGKNRKKLSLFLACLPH